MKNKALVILYPGFSLYEINCLTSYLTISLNEEESWLIETSASSMKPVISEDYFSVNPTKSFDEVDINDYKLIILPGIIDYTKAIDDIVLIDFLSKLNTTNRPLIASISSSPILLAKAGLLRNVQFTAGLFEETINDFTYLSSDQLTRTPVHFDKENQIITAIGFAFREFAIETLRALNFDVQNTLFSGTLIKKYSKEELTYRLN
ncbi:DJ-1/PfpI family protein [Macrococcoides caseolyticum]|uniref:DJ-1/PfpI family protein n=1 Tax=Macrococcoides caseolyticum TaxID=69966 RepID=UPI000A28FAC3|nr:DJ-1/PfpI family protein [Macrococcus caseolyticus]ARQ04483.1 DJ-1/PfpI family protein [Macrococcus caseolyticus]PKD98111.1 4-methyl-5(B-hydroxyethyl)-thiazole monophosphate biosynthesis protein [Macrococcus caseolyticus]PKE18902.1 4-methyl-5(B-hydroxyethyl)-thiazole monophosphate biosynthesis protein [Macrococcus caseolyticus]PKE35026.1 4-methyl-5(B-hydroxyethyl)-thiazole monophosphate biosynthesis protein [Macrococcus caseolyticus]PKE73684.1 4-methyl-5(B-hydroxyethyl)-thiazole monophospha